MRFRHEVIDEDPPGSELDIALLADVDGDGRLDIIIGGKRGEANLFWYRNPTWERHAMAVAPQLEAGGVCVDLTGNGRPDVVAGQQIGGRELYWFEGPPDPTAPWRRRLITNRFEKYHDQAVGDLDGDGEPELLFASQGSGVLAYFDLPADPWQEPWPEANLHVIGQGLGGVEGLVIADLDGDGAMEVLAGPNVFRRGGRGRWERRGFAPDFEMTRVAVADLDGDGALEVVLSEGESDRGRLAICQPPDYALRVLRDDLFHPHSLQVADFDGDGAPDLLVGEMGLGRNQSPRLMILVNRGAGRFEEEVIQTGVPVHEAKAGDLTGNGRPDIAGKPYHPQRHVDIWWNED